MKVTYPVIFTDIKTNILIEVPDLNILTEANEEGKEKGFFCRRYHDGKGCYRAFLDFCRRQRESL